MNNLDEEQMQHPVLLDDKGKVRVFKPDVIDRGEEVDDEMLPKSERSHADSPQGPMLETEVAIEFRNLVNDRYNTVQAGPRTVEPWHKGNARSVVASKPSRRYVRHMLSLDERSTLTTATICPEP